MYIDAHAHIDRHFFGDGLPGVIERFRKAGVDWVVTVGSSADLAIVRDAIDVAVSNPDVVAAIGVHPHEADAVNDALLDEIAGLASSHRVRAIGETGLDFHYGLSSRHGQMEAFSRQLNLASGLGLPVVIHSREAFRESIDVVSSWSRPAMPGQVHCFTGGIDEVREWLDLGFMVSIPGVVTFRNTDAMAAAVRFIPDDRILIETDSPYLAPVPMRGKTNEPAFVTHTAAAVARIRGVSVEHVARVTSDNAARLFKLA